MARSNVVTPNEAARKLSSRLGRTITPKMVRAMARDRIGAYDKATHPAYQSHGYTPAQFETLRKAFEARTPRAVASKATPRKARTPRTPRKATPPASAEATA